MENLKIRHNKYLILYFITFLFFSLLVFFAQNTLPISDFLKGIFIPDVVNMSTKFNYLQEDGDVSFLFTPMAGVYYIYWFAWITHPAFSFLINLVFIYFSLRLLQEIFVKNNIASSLVCLGILINPYLYLAVTGPNKEIPLIWATLFIVRNIISKRKWGLIQSIIISLLVVQVRDGYGVILLLSIILFSTKVSTNSIWKLALLFAFALAVLFDFAVSNFSFLERNVLVTKSLVGGAQNSAFIGNLITSNTSPIFSVLKQAVRMFYNWLTLSMFPIFATQSGDFFTLGIAYWVFGVFISISILACIYVLFFKYEDNLVEKQRKKIAGLVIFFWATISISLFIQPRYLMPILPLAFGILISLSKMRRLLLSAVMVFYSFSVITIYSIFGNPPAKTSVDDISLSKIAFLLSDDR